MYKQVKRPIGEGIDSTVILRVNDKLTIPVDLANTDYQAYLKWLAEGNTPLPADE